MSSPARVASGWAELTMPEVPTAGLLGVFSLHKGLAGAESIGAEVVAARPSCKEVVISRALSS